jgi:exopolysaccharide biosynthesis polyprenyl glycosylphosphotransferase
VGLVLAVRAVAYHLIQKPPRVQRVLIIGGGPMAQELITEIQARPELRFKIVGVVEDDPASVPAGCARLGSLKDLARVATDVHPDRVIVALASRRGRMPYKTLLDLRLRGILVEDGVEVGERMTGKVAIEALTPSSLIFAREFKPFHLDLALARVASVPTAAAGLILLSPLFALIALAIRLDSAGPLFFVQERVGLQGRLFRLIKFRTMHPTRGATSEWVKDNQGRLTRVGRWLRRFRLDELPQLVNILRGDMNLVGPRPHPLSNLPLFVMVMRNTPECGEQIPYYALRSMVRPGLTGWAQVRYHYANDLEEEIEKMRYDLYYTKHRSAWLDLRILLETVKIVLRGRESALKAAAEERPHGPETGPRPRPAAGNGAAAARRAGAA